MKPLVFKEDGKFKGFLIDLMNRIGEISKFVCDFYLVPDGFFGSKKNETHWDGSVGEVQSKVILSDYVYMCRSLLNNERKTLSYTDDCIIVGQICEKYVHLWQKVCQFAYKQSKIC